MSYQAKPLLQRAVYPWRVEYGVLLNNVTRVFFAVKFCHLENS